MNQYNVTHDAADKQFIVGTPGQGSSKSFSYTGESDKGAAEQAAHRHAQSLTADSSAIGSSHHPAGGQVQTMKVRHLKDSKEEIMSKLKAIAEANGKPVESETSKEEHIIEGADPIHPYKQAAEAITDTHIQDMADSVKSLEDILDAYKDEELCVVDSDGKIVKGSLKEEDAQLNEVLTRIDRINAAIRMDREEGKLVAKRKLALHKVSSGTTLTSRARTMAVALLKKKLTKKDPTQLSVEEKERVERILQTRKELVSRLAMKLVPKIRKIEQARLHGGAR